MEITQSIKYVGVNDHDITLFEGMYEVEKGMAYNSYAIIDDKIAIMDSVDINFGDEWINNIKGVLEGRSPDYLIVQHMEPDHSACILKFLEEFPSATIVSSSKAFTMMMGYFKRDFKEKRIVVSEGDTLCLGKHVLKFISAPMVHWPEVIVTYDEYDKVLFTADGFGKFGANDIEDSWACEARRYYFGIVGKFGMQVQALLKKASSLQINAICPLHGPVLSENLPYYLNLYNIWSSYGVESEGVFIAYTSIYGNTQKAVLELERQLKEKGVKVSVANLATEDWAECVEDAFKYGKLVLATTTYNGEIFPTMRSFISKLVERNYQNRLIGIIENGSWAPNAARCIKAAFEKSKNITFTDTTVKILCSLDEESAAQLAMLAEQLV